MVHAALCWRGRKHDDFAPLPFSLTLNNIDHDWFPAVGNEATGKLFGAIFFFFLPGRGTCAVTRKTSAVECEPPAVA